MKLFLSNPSALLLGFGTSFNLRRGLGVFLTCLCLWLAEATCSAQASLAKGNRVQTTGSVSVRQSPAGTAFSTGQPYQAKGTITDGPKTATLSGESLTWYNVNFDSGNDGWVASKFLSLVAVVAKPAVPSGASPGTSSGPGPTLTSSTVSLTWSAVSGATSYIVGVVDAVSGAVVVSTTTTSPSYTAALTAGKQYKWNVAARNSAGDSLYCPLLYFQTQALLSKPGIPTGASPGGSSPGPTLTSSTVSLTWSAVSGATSYIVGVVDAVSGAVVVSTTTASPSYTAALTAGKQYKWNVAARNSAGDSLYCPLLYFQTQTLLAKPGVPTGASPGGVSPGPTLTSSTVSLTWSAVSGATSYIVGVVDDASGAVVVSTTTSSPSYTAALTAGKRYKWNVAARNAAGESLYCPLLYFQTQAAVVLIGLPNHAYGAGLTTGNSANPYNLEDLDPSFDFGPQRYAKYGNLMSAGETLDGNSIAYYPFTKLTELPSTTSPTRSLFFLKTDAGGAYTRVEVPQSSFSGNNVNRPSSFGQEEYRLMRKFYFLNTLLDQRGSDLGAATKKLIILVHGWNPKSRADSITSEEAPEFSRLNTWIRDALSANSDLDWQFSLYHWEKDSDTGGKNIYAANNATRAAIHGHYHGQHLGELLRRKCPNLEKVHFIAHSAGTWTARAATKHLLQLTSAKCQVTLLDPFIPAELVGLSDVPLNSRQVTSLATFPTQRQSQLVRLENYFVFDFFGSDFGGSPTSVSFGWPVSLGIEKRIDWTDDFSGQTPPHYGTHDGPIGFYGDTVRYANSDELRPGLAKFASQLEDIGWKRSMFYEEYRAKQGAANRPNITSFVPPEIAAGAAVRTVSLTIRGTGFKSTSIVSFDRADVVGAFRRAVSRYVSSTELSCDFEVGTSAGDWKFMVTTDGLNSDPATFRVTAPLPTVILPPRPPSELLAGLPFGPNADSYVFFFELPKPAHPRPISTVWWKLGRPTSPTDGAFRAASDVEIQIQLSPTDSRDLYVWLEDVDGRKDHNQAKTITLQPPTPVTAKGALRVTLSGASGRWRVDSGLWQVSGFTLTDIGVGARSIQFDAVEGYTTPAPKPVTVIANTTVSETGVYVAVPKPRYTLTVQSSPTEGGSVTIQSQASDYAAGSAVTLRAEPLAGYDFDSWSGDAAGSNPTTVVQMNGNKTVTASFRAGGYGNLLVEILPQDVVTAGAKFRDNNGPVEEPNALIVMKLPGQHPISFTPVTGWKTPSPVSASVRRGETATVRVQYEAETPSGTLQVVLSPPAAVAAGAKWRLNSDTLARDSRTDTLTPGPYTITFEPVEGWDKPAAQTVTVNAGQPTVGYGVYELPSGLPVITAISPPIGPLAGGTLVTILGANFTASSTVTFGDKAAASVTFVSANELRATTPAASSYGTATVTVQTGSEVAINTGGFAYGVTRGSGMQLVSSIGGRTDAVAVNGSYAYIGEGSSMVVFNVATPSAPALVARVTLPGMVKDIALTTLAGKLHACVAANDAGVQLVDVSIPASPRVVGYYQTSQFASGIALLGSLAYVVDGSSTFQVLDVSTPAAPRLAGSVVVPGEALFDLVLKGAGSQLLCYLATSRGLRIVDVTSAESPLLKGGVNLGNRQSLAVVGTRAYLCGGVSLVSRVDVTNPDGPFLIDDFAGAANALAATSSYLFRATDSTFSVHNPAASAFLAPLGQAAHSGGAGQNIAVSGSLAYVPKSDGGLAIYDFSNLAAVRLVGQYFGNPGNAFGLALKNGNIYVAGGNAGIHVLSGANPLTPSVLSTKSTGGFESRVVIDGNLLSSTDGTVLRAFDVGNPANPVLRGTSSADMVIGDLTVWGAFPVGAGHKLANLKPVFRVYRLGELPSIGIQGEVQLAATTSSLSAVAAVRTIGCVGSVDGFLGVIDLTSSTQPTERGNLTGFGRIVSLAFMEDGSHVLVGTFNPNQLHIVNVVNVNAPQLVSTLSFDREVQSICVSGNTAFAGIANGDVVQVDFSAVALPRVIRSYKTAAYPRSVAVLNDYVYVADASGGVNVLKLLDTTAPQLSILQPTVAATFQSANATVDLAGTASDNKGVVQVAWANNRGGNGVASGTALWSASGITLQTGVNIITVTAFDADGNKGTALLTVTYSTAQSQTITFANPGAKTFGGPDFKVLPQASSGLSVSVARVSGPATVDANNMIHLTGAGPVTLRASQTGSLSYLPAQTVDVTFTALPASAVVSFGELSARQFGERPFTVTASASSGATVSFSVVSGGPATVAGNMVTLTGAGRVRLRGDAPATTDYNAAFTEAEFEVAKAVQAITFEPLGGQSLGDAPFALSASSSAAGLAVNFALVAGSPATLTGSTLTVTNVGTVTVRATQVGNINYLAAEPVEQSFTVTAIRPSITAQPAGLTVDAGATATLSAAASGSPVLGYYWRKDGAVVAGATTPTLTIANAQPTNTGVYDMVVTNLAGHALSERVLLFVNGPPAITGQPQNTTTDVDGNALFLVSAVGTPPLSYQWRKAGVTIPDATNGVFLLTNATAASAGNYEVVVTNVAGSTTSSVAQLVFNTPANTASAIESFDAFVPAQLLNSASGGSPAVGQFAQVAGYITVGPVNGGNPASGAGFVRSVNLNLTGANGLLLTARHEAGDGGTVVKVELRDLDGSVSSASVAASNFPVGSFGTVTIPFGTNGSGGTVAGLNLSQVASYTLSAEPGSAPFRMSFEHLEARNTNGPAVGSSIVTQPLSQSVEVGATVTLSVVAGGTAPFTYQWRKDLVNVPGATTGTLVLSSVGTNASGSYDVLVSNIVAGVVSVPAVVAVNRLAQSVTFGVLPAKTVGDSSFALGATASSGQLVNYVSSAPSVASVSVSTVTVVGPGVTTFTASQAGDASYLPAVSVAQTLTVNAVAPAVTTPPGNQTANVGGTATFSVTASGTAPLAYQWRKNGVALGGATGASLVLGNLTTNDAGSFDVVVVNIAGSVTSAPPAVLTVNRLGQTITFAALTARQVGDLAFTLGATADSGLAVSYVSSAPSVATVSGSTVTIVGAGATTITASQVGDARYQAATSVGQALTVGGVAPALTAQPQAVTTVVSNTITLNAAASGTAPLAYQWRKNGAAIGGATSAGLTLSTVTTNDTGSFDLVVTNAYGSVTSVVAQVTIGRLPQTLTFGALAAKTVGDASFAVNATTTSPLSVSYTSSAPGVASVSGSTVTVVGPGTTTITASQGGDASYQPAVSVSQSLAVNAVMPSVTTPPGNQTANVGGTATFSVTASGTAPLAYQWRKNGVPLGGATGTSLVLGNLTTNDAGSFDVVVANIAGSVTSAPPAVLTVNRLGQTITFAALGGRQVGDAAFELNATADSGLQVSYASSDAGVATVSGSTVTIVGAGTTTIAASQAGDARYQAATSVARTLGVTAAYALTVNAANGTVSKSPDQTSYAANTAVTLTASPDAGYTFTGWSGDANGATNPLVVTMTGNKSIVANFSVVSLAGLVAQYRLNGDGQDSGQNLFHGTVTSATATTNRTGDTGKAMSFDGTTARVEVANNATLQGLTTISVSGWFRPDTSANAGRVFSKGNAWQFYVQNSQFELYVGGNRITIPSSIVGAWHHVAFTSGGGNTKLYLDGTQIGSGAFSVPADAAPVLIGGLFDTGSVPTGALFKGAIDDVRIFNRALSASEVLSVMNSSEVPPIEPPVVTASPASLTVNAGSSAAFAVTATGTAPLAYQWRKNGQNIPSATSSTYSIGAAQASDVGTYDVVVANGGGLATSTAATLAVVMPPSIVAQPQAQTAVVGATASLSVSAAGSAPLNYQWRKAGVNIGGATSATLALSNLTTNDAGSFDVVVTNAAGSVTSAPPAVVAVNRLAQSVTFGALAAKTVGDSSFALGATTTSPLPVSYVSSALGVASVSGSTATVVGPGTTTITASQGGDASYLPAVSVSQVLTVNAVAPAVTAAPANQTTNVGGVVAFSVTASGTAPLVYQWRKNGVALGGATGASLVLGNLTTNDAGSFDVVVNNVAGSVTSAPPAVLTVNRLTQTITFAALTARQVGDLSFTLGAAADSGLAVSFASSDTSVATVSGGTVTIAGAGSTTITASQAGDARYQAATSVGRVLTVGGVAPTLTAQPQGATTVVSNTVTLNAAASGSAPLAYQWRKNGVAIGGATSAGLTLNTVMTNDTGSFDLVVTNAYGSVTSVVAQVTIGRLPQTLTFGALATKTVGDASFAVNATTTSPLPVSYGSSAPGVASVNGSTVTVVGPGTTTITASQGGDANYQPAVSASQPLTVNAVAPAVTTPPGNQTANVGGTATFSVTASGTAPLAYQWRKNGVPLGGATGASLVLGNLTTNDAGSFDVVVVNIAGSVISAPPAVLTVVQNAQFGFTRVINGSVGNVAGPSLNISWGDIRGDGIPDLIYGRYEATALLHQGSADGAFVPVTGVLPVAAALKCQGALWGDFDNDGLLDLVLVLDGVSQVFRNVGDGTFTAVAIPALTAAPGNYLGGAWVDYDRDGKLDLFLPRHDGPSLLLKNLGGGAFSNAAPAITASGRACAWGDVDNDGWPDVYLVGANTLFRNNANGTFSAVTLTGMTSLSSKNGVSANRGATSAAWGDFNNDGRLDLLVTYDGATPSLYRNDGNGAFTYINLTSVVNQTGGATWADFDNDGYLDLVFSGGTFLGSQVLKNNNGDGSFTRIQLPGNHLLAVGVGVADYDRDGQQDIGLAVNGGGSLLYRNNGTTNAWLTVRPTSATSGGVMMGARVTVTAMIAGQLRTQIREFFGGGSIGSQSFPEAGFGLGDATEVQSLRIDWPTGSAQTYTNLSVRQILTLQQVPPTVSLGVVLPPQSQSLPVLTNALLTVTASGVGPLAYQWRRNALPMNGETNVVLVISSLSTNDAASYDVVVSNTQGSVTSAPPAVLTVNRLGQAIAFGALADRTIGAPSFTLGGTASSALPVSYTSSTPGVATVSGNTVSLVGLGTTTITASQAGDAIYLPATNVSQTLAVLPPLPVFTLTTVATNGQVARTPAASSYPQNSQVALTAMPNRGYAFAGWTGDAAGTANPLTVTMDRARNVVANFAPTDLSGLLAHYRLDGDGQDSSSNGFHGAVVNTATTTNRLGEPGTALFFDGDTAHLPVPNNSTLQNLSAATVAAWFRPDATANDARIVSKSESWQLSYIQTGGFFEFASVPVPNGVANRIRFYTNLVGGWHHAAFTFANGTTVLYLDGTEVGRTNTVTALPTFAGPVVIGGLHDSGSIPRGALFRGAVDDVRIFGRALSATELREVVNGAEALTTLAPTISAQPQGIVASAGGSVTFGVAANGAGPFTYQWRKNGQSLPGATLGTLGIVNVGTNDAGAYDVLVGNAGGSVGSAPASLTVSRLSQGINFGPLTARIAGSGSFALSAAASSGLTVQFSSSNPGVAIISGATVIVVGPGATTITGRQDGDGTFEAASLVHQTLVVFAPPTDDTTPPVIGSINLSPFVMLETATNLLNISGTAFDDVAVSQVTYVNDRGGSGTAVGTNEWTIAGIVLLPGTNVISVTARDPNGNSSTVDLWVNYLEGGFVLRHKGMQPDRKFRMDVEGPSNRAVIIEASSNLVTWAAVQNTNLDPFGRHAFQDDGAFGPPRLFYRARAIGSAAPFSDGFNRPDAPSVGNGWTVVPGANGVAWVVANNQLTVSADSSGLTGIYRSQTLTAPVRVTAVLHQKNGYGTLAKRYGYEIGLLSTGAVGSGYRLVIGRSDENFANSTIRLFDGANSVGSPFSPDFQFGTQILIDVTFRPDGVVTGTVSGDGRAAAFSFAAYQPQSAGDKLMIVTETGGITLRPTIDDVSVTYP